MKNTVKVIMLPTEDKSNLINDKAIGLQYNSIPLNNTLGYNPQHLYFTSDEEIKEGDWCINEKYPNKPFKNINLEKGQGVIKIIATTNTKLVLSDKFTTYDILPQIPQSFVEKYAKQGGIDEVELEHKSFILLNKFRRQTNRQILPEIKLELTDNNEVIVHLI